MKLLESGYTAPEIARTAGLLPESVRTIARGADMVTERTSALLLAVRPEVKEAAA